MKEGKDTVTLPVVANLREVKNILAELSDEELDEPAYFATPDGREGEILEEFYKRETNWPPDCIIATVDGIYIRGKIIRVQR